MAEQGRDVIIRTKAGNTPFLGGGETVEELLQSRCINRYAKFFSSFENFPKNRNTYVFTM